MQIRDRFVNNWHYSVKQWHTLRNTIVYNPFKIWESENLANCPPCTGALPVPATTKTVDYGCCFVRLVATTRSQPWTCSQLKFSFASTPFPSTWPHVRTRRPQLTVLLVNNIIITKCDKLRITAYRHFDSHQIEKNLNLNYLLLLLSYY